MDLTNLKLFSMTAKKLDWLSKRQIVLSQNLANADTPSYAPRDLKALGFRDLLRRKTVRQGLEQTNTMHIAATRKPPKHSFDSKKDTYESSPGGNAVILEEQLTKISETQANQRLASNIYSKQVALLKMALGKPVR